MKKKRHIICTIHETIVQTIEYLILYKIYNNLSVSLDCGKSNTGVFNNHSAEGLSKKKDPFTKSNKKQEIKIRLKIEQKMTQILFFLIYLLMCYFAFFSSR